MGGDPNEIVEEALDRIAMGASRPPADFRGRVDQLKHLRTIIDEALASINEDGRRVTG